MKEHMVIMEYYISGESNKWEQTNFSEKKY